MNQIGALGPVIRIYIDISSSRLRMTDLTIWHTQPYWQTLGHAKCQPIRTLLGQHYWESFGEHYRKTLIGYTYTFNWDSFICVFILVMSDNCKRDVIYYATYQRILQSQICLL